MSSKHLIEIFQKCMKKAKDDLSPHLCNQILKENIESFESILINKPIFKLLIDKLEDKDVLYLCSASKKINSFCQRLVWNFRYPLISRCMKMNFDTVRQIMQTKPLIIQYMRLLCSGDLKNIDDVKKFDIVKLMSSKRKKMGLPEDYEDKAIKIIDLDAKGISEYGLIDLSMQNLSNRDILLLSKAVNIANAKVIEEIDLSMNPKLTIKSLKDLGQIKNLKTGGFQETKFLDTDDVQIVITDTNITRDDAHKYFSNIIG